MEPQGSLHQFREGDLALLIDRKDRRYLVTLEAAGTFHSHSGLLRHADIIGREHGARLTTSQGQGLLAISPTLADYATHLPRESQVIYPKDLGAILVYADIFPGARVVEAGTGSGALTTSLLRAVGPHGAVFSYEVREQIVGRARRNIERAIPQPDNLTMHVADVYQGMEEHDVDRVVLDLPEPWRAVPTAAEALVPGGILLAFLPTALQVYHLGLVLQEHPSFDLVESLEVMVRPWHIAPRSIRPVHRMVAHTGFIVTSRKCTPKRSGQPQGSAASQEDAASLVQQEMDGPPA